LTRPGAIRRSDHLRELVERCGNGKSGTCIHPEFVVALGRLLHQAARPTTSTTPRGEHTSSTHWTSSRTRHHRPRPRRLHDGSASRDSSL